MFDDSARSLSRRSEIRHTVPTAFTDDDDHRHHGPSPEPLLDRSLIDKMIGERLQIGRVLIRPRPLIEPARGCTRKPASRIFHLQLFLLQNSSFS